MTGRALALALTLTLSMVLFLVFDPSEARVGDSLACVVILPSILCWWLSASHNLTFACSLLALAVLLFQVL